MVLVGVDLMNVLDCIRDLDCYFGNIGYCDDVTIISILNTVNPVVETVTLYGSLFRVTFRRVNSELILLDYMSRIPLDLDYILRVMNSVFRGFNVININLGKLVFHVGVCDAVYRMPIQGLIEFDNMQRASIYLH